MKQISTLLIALFLLSANAVFAQWQVQDIPQTQGTPHIPFSGATVGKDILWMATQHFGFDSTANFPIEYVRTIDGGATYQTGEILPNHDDYWYHLQPYDANTAYLLTAFQFGEPYAIRKTSDAGATWNEMAFTPPTFPGFIHFFDDNNGAYGGDPDSLGFYFAYTTDGGNTFTRLPQTNYPPTLNDNEYLNSSGSFLVGNTIFIGTFDFEGNYRILRSTDMGRNWSVSEAYSSNFAFGDNSAFTDNENGFHVRNFFEDQNSYFTENGGATWQENNTPLPGRLTGGNISNVPGTNNFVAIFEDTTDQILFSAATNDYGKSWHSRKDLVPYTLDPIYEPNLPAFAWTNLKIIDNHTAWAKFSRNDLYRYDSAEPLIPEKPDLELSIVTDNEYLDNYTSVKYTLLIRNRGITAATDVQTHWLPPYNRTPSAGEPYAFQAAYSDGGNFNWWTGDWDIKNLQPGQIMTATYHLFVLKDDAKVDISAQITACNELDLDSAPNNGGAGLHEDDEVTFTATPSFASEPSEDRTTMPTISVFPNPAKDAFFVNYNFDEKKDVSFTVNDAVGRLIWSNTLNNAQIGIEKVDCSTLTAGIYFVKTMADGVVTTVQKVVIAH
jgi:photosystem II stability/assembly factor-like uncharacterized protein